MENFNVRNFCEEKFLRITHIETKTFFDFRSLAFEFKENVFCKDSIFHLRGENQKTAKCSPRKNF